MTGSEGMVEKREKEFRRYFFLRRKLFPSSRRRLPVGAGNDEERHRAVMCRYFVIFAEEYSMNHNQNNR